jgi:hexokinase
MCVTAAHERLAQKYPGFADRVHEGLYDVFGDKGKSIITHHAEDGSGVGSAIIAGLLSLMLFFWGGGLTPGRLAAMTKIRKEAGLYTNV